MVALDGSAGRMRTHAVCLLTALCMVASLLGLAVPMPAAAAPPKVQISAGPPRSTRTVVAAAGRNAYAAWEDWSLFDGVRVIRFARSLDRGEHWVRPGAGVGLLAFAEGATPAIAAIGNEVHVAWVHTPPYSPGDPNKSEIWYRRSTDRGVSFESVRILDSGESPQIDSSAPDIVVSASGAWVTWENGAQGVRVAAMVGNDPPVVRDLGPGRNPQIGTSGGSVAVAFDRAEAGPGAFREVLVASSADGSTFDTPVNVSVSAGVDSAYPALAFNEGDMHVAWHEGTTLSSIRVASSTDTGASFGPPLTLGEAPGSYPWGTPTIAAAEGLIGVAWVAPDGRSVQVAASHDHGGSFGAPTAIPGNVQGAPTLAAPAITEPGPHATFDWIMPERFGLDEDGDGLIDERNDAIFISPSTWPVELDGCGSRSDAPGAMSYAWKIDGALVAGTTCKITHAFPDLGEHEVQLTVSQPGGLHDKRVRTIDVRDRLVVSIGDSIASGEGTPDSPLPDLEWNDQQCDRSALAGPAQAALKLEEADPHSSVTFVHLACSGATILGPDIGSGGLLTPYEGINPGPTLPPQVDRVAALIGSRDIDALLVSIGANDAKFSEVVIDCIAFPQCQNGSTAEDFNTRLAALPGRYDQLATALDPLVAPEDVFITEYPDPTVPESGAWDLSCVANAAIPGGTVTDAESRWAGQHLVPALNGAVTSAASTHGWNLVSDISSGFVGHGYCAAEHWIVQLGESLDSQDDVNGAFHPNFTGHQRYASRVASSVGTLWRAEDDTPPPPDSISAPLGDLYLGWSDSPNFNVSALVESGSGVSVLSTHVQSVPNNDLGAGFFSVAATEEGAWAGWTEQTNGTEPSDLNGFRAFVGTAFSAPPDLRAIEAGLVQGPSDPVALVADRTTGVEVNIDSRFTQPIQAEVGYSITEVPGGSVAASGSQPMSLVPGENVVLVNPTSAFKPEDGKDYRAVITLDPGDAIPEADEDDNVVDSPVVPARPSHGLKIVYVPFSGASCSSTMNLATRSRAFLDGVLPVPDGSITSATNCGMSASASANAAGITKGLNDLGALAKMAGADVVVGVAPPGWVTTAFQPGAIGLALVGGGGASDPSTAAAIVDQNYAGDVVAHEILHAYGRDHVPDVPADGFWVANNARIRGMDLMHPAIVPEPWISPATYEYFRNRLAHTLSDPTVIVVRGTIDAVGDVTGEPWYRQEGILDVPLGATGGLTLEYRDADGDVLDSTGFDAASLDAVGAGTGPSDGDQAFNVRVPDAPAGTTDLVLLDGTDEVLTREVSASAPTNDVTAPTAGAVIPVGQSVEVEITSDDADGGALHHAVLVSSDDGATWRPLALDVTGSTFSFPARTDLVSDQVRVRVLTTDGVRTAISDSPMFEISADVDVDNRIVYVRHRYEMLTSTEGLWMMDPDGGNQVEVPLPLSGTLPQDNIHTYEPDWSPDGSRIVFSSQLVEDAPGVYHHDQFSHGQLWSVRPSGSDLTPLTQPDGTTSYYRCPKYSPDGTQIAMFARAVTGGFPDTLVQGIWVMNADGSDLHTVVEFPAGLTEIGQNREEDSSTCPVWSPDGSRLAFAAHEDFDHQHIYVVDVDGTDFGVLWDGPPPPWEILFLKGLDWSPEGDVLVSAWTVEDNIQVSKEWAIPTDGGDPRILFTRPGELPLHMQLTPDATRFYAVREVTAPTYTQNISELHTYALDGTDDQVFRAPDNAWDVLWPDWIGGEVVEPPPTPGPAWAGGPYTATEDVELQLDAGQSTLAEGEVPLAEWDLDGDGAFDDALGLRPLVTFPHSGPVVVTVRITPAGGSAQVSPAVTVDVAPAAPLVSVLTPDAVAVGKPTSLSAAFVDAGGDPHTASVDWGDGSAVEAVTVTPTPEGGTVTGSHTYASTSSHTVRVEVCDEGGPCAHDEVGAVVAASAPANLPPTAGNTAITTGAGSPVWIPLPAADPEGVVVAVDSLGAAAYGTVAPLPGDGGAGVVYTPDDGFVGIDSFTYIVSDGRSASGAATVTVTVGNLPPTPGNDQVSGGYGVPTEIAASALLANDSDPDDTGDLSMAGAYEISATHGTLERDGDTVTYTPDEGFAGTATFEYAVSDGNAIGVGSVDVVIDVPADVPGPPLDVSAIGGDASADVVWNPPTSDGGSTLTGYEVRIVGTATVTPVAGAVEEATVTGLVNGTDYTFEVRAQNATGFGPWSAPSNVARPRATCAVDAFTDVPDDHPFCPEIFWMADNGIAQGYADGSYRPGAAVARQAMAAFLYRLAGSERGPDPVCDTAPFPDVPVTHTFCGEIDWMVDEQITGGFDDGTFRPAASISRMAMAAFLYRLAGSERGPDPVCTSAPFTDVSTSHPFCGEIDWMVDNGITGGFDDGTFRPAASISRQAMAAYIFRYEILTGILG